MKNETIENYVVCLVDILGQKNKLTQLNSLNIKDDREQVLKLLRDTYGKIKKFHQHMYGAISWLDGITRLDKDEFDSKRIQISSFSDLIASYISLRDDEYKVSFKGLYYLLFGNGLVFLQMLSEKSALRGGIDLGIGIEYNDNGSNKLYGSALSNPYHIESNIAINPRIVIGKTLYEYIKSTSDEETTADPLGHNIHFAKKCMEIIKKDLDGEYILDYLSEPFQKMENFDYHHKQAQKFIDEELFKFQSMKQDKEVKKYEYIISYFKSSGLSQVLIEGE